MPKLIDTAGKTRDNPWQLLDRDCTLETALARPSADIIVPLALWLAEKAVLQARTGRTGVWLGSDQQVHELKDDLNQIPLIALHFPVFMDGRAYSGAVTLRTHYGYQGEIRAIGDVLRDQLFYMKRCGFTTFDLSDSVKLEDAASAMHDFTDSYQATVEEPMPLFKRRQGR